MSLDYDCPLHVGGVDSADVVVGPWSRKGEAETLAVVDENCGTPERYWRGRVDHSVSGDGRVRVNPDNCVVNAEHDGYR